MNQFEDRVHTVRRDEGELSVDRFGELWAETQTELLGDAVEVTDGYRSWWSYVPHFIGTPGYVYAYAYGQLLALSVYRLYLERGEEIVPDYLEMLASGGSRPPEELAAIVGVDLTDPGFWDRGLDLVAEQLDAGRGGRRAGPRRRLSQPADPISPQSFVVVGVATLTARKLLDDAGVPGRRSRFRLTPPAVAQAAEPSAGPKMTITTRSSSTRSKRCSSPAATKTTEPGPTAMSPFGPPRTARPERTT